MTVVFCHTAVHDYPTHTVVNDVPHYRKTRPTDGRKKQKKGQKSLQKPEIRWTSEYPLPGSVVINYMLMNDFGPVFYRNCQI